MKPLQITLAIVALVFLTVQSVRHIYVGWLEPRGSVLDRFDHPLKDEIAAATSVEQLVQRYEPVRKEADRVRAEREKTNPTDQYVDQEQEPFKSERELRDAIKTWERRSKEIHAVRFYWTVGFVLVLLGLAAYLRINRWFGLTVLIIGFSEIIYWTSPSFLSETREFERLLTYKVTFSLISLVLLVVVVRLLAIFSWSRDSSPSRS